MNKEEVVIKVGVDTKQATNSVAALKKELKEAQAAALNGDGKAAKRVAELKDKMEDLRDSTRSLQGSGVEKVSTSFNLLGEGLGNFDFDKIKTGFKGIGAAMSAIPLVLIVQGISYLIENFDKLKNSGGLLGKALTFIGDVVTGLGHALEILGDKLGLVDMKMNMLSDTIEKYAKDSQDLLAKQNAEWDRNIKLTAASGASTVEMEKQKQEAIKKTNTQMALNLMYLQESLKLQGKDISDEQKKQLDGFIEAAKNANNELKVIDAKTKKEQHDRDVEAYNKKKALRDQETAEIIAAQKAIDENVKNNKQKTEDELIKSNQKEVDANKLKNEEIRVNNEDAKDQEALMNEKYEQLERERNRAHREQMIKNGVEMTRQGLQSAQALSDLYFTYQLSKAKGNAAKELEIKKKAFQVDKAFQLGQATIDGYRAVLNAYATAPPGFKIASSVLAGLFAIAQIGKIASAKFDPGTTSAPSIDTGGGGGNVGSGSSNTPQLNTQAPIINPTTNFDSNGRNLNYQRVYVVEKDITDTQSRVAKLEAQRTI